MTRKSEFGKGLVYNLVLFAKHFENDMAKNIGNIDFLLSKSEAVREKIISSNPEPQYDYGKDMEFAIFWYKKIMPIRETPEKSLSSEIETWANGASDHLYDIQLPKDKKIAKKVKRLQSKALKMGHGFSGVIWTMKDFYGLMDLTKEIARDLDRYYGIEVSKAEWE